MGELKELLAAVSGVKSDWVGAVTEHFGRLSRRVALRGAEVDLLDAGCWPRSAGVYLIWHAPVRGAPKTLLYVGKAGTLKATAQGGCAMGGSTLAARLSRWTPYAFKRKGPDRGHFLFGPTFKGLKPPAEDSPGAYSHRIPLREIVVDCVQLNGIETSVSPALLEALLLQGYLAEHRHLPPANREL